MRQDKPHQILIAFAGTNHEEACTNPDCFKFRKVVYATFDQLSRLNSLLNEIENIPEPGFKLV